MCERPIFDGSLVIGTQRCLLADRSMRSWGSSGELFEEDNMIAFSIYTYQTKTASTIFGDGRMVLRVRVHSVKESTDELECVGASSSIDKNGGGKNCSQHAGIRMHWWCA